MPLSIRVTGLEQARALVARWNPLAYIAAASGPVGDTVLGSLRLFINVRTGHTRDTLAAGLAGSHLLFGGDAIAGYLAFGTRPHTITARTARMLAFPGSDGRTVFARSVRHPGTRPYDYPQRAADASAPTVGQIARQQALAVLLGGA